MTEYHLLVDGNDYLVVSIPSYACGCWHNTIFESAKSFSRTYDYDSILLKGTPITDPAVTAGTKHRYVLTFPRNFDPKTITAEEIAALYPELLI